MQKVKIDEIMYAEDGPLLRMEPEFARKYAFPVSINLNALNFNDLELMGKVLSLNGLSSLVPRWLIEKTPSQKGNDEFNKLAYLRRIAAIEAKNIFEKGHVTVFDLVHNYYSTSPYSQYNSTDDINGLPPLKIILGNDNYHDNLISKMIDYAPLQLFFIHHKYQRYVTCFDMNLMNQENAERLADKILEEYNLKEIVNYLISTESRFCFDQEEKLRKYAGQLPGDKIKIPLSEANGFVINEIEVPIYEDKKSFSEIEDKSQQDEIFASNPMEKAYIMHRNPGNPKYKHVPESLGLDSRIMDVLLEYANYPGIIQTKMLKRNMVCI